VLAIAGAVWQFEDRFVNAEEMAVSIDSAKSENEAQHQQIKLYMDVGQHRQLIRAELEWQLMAEKHPNNGRLKDTLADIQEERSLVEARIQARLE